MSSAVRRSFQFAPSAIGIIRRPFCGAFGHVFIGSFVQTMVLADIATGSTECIPSAARQPQCDHVDQAGSLAVPFPLLGVDFDNDSAFMNALVVSWCAASIWR
ncbi:hypothetical protein [Mesorhizobium sp. L-8-10]|uniref:hypothetical protein n=1 Tax=Mesorhizobium sp. L-8-10 TaxID=2744523 RepID=UPI00192838EF|nr:hypothetical protein [Mesorhizobium sp. L-8-10]